MMCTGCENRVQNVVSKIENIESVDANYEDGTVTIKTKGYIELNKVKKTIENLDYEVIEEK